MKLQTLWRALPLAFGAALTPAAFAGAAGTAGTVPANPPLAASAVSTTPIITPSIRDDVQAQMTAGTVSVPAGFDLSIFATPPVVFSTVAVAAAADGTVYAGLDGNSAQGQWAGVGRIVRLRDTNNDGVADEAKAFVPSVDSVRGMVWYNDRLIVMHAPNISAFYDRDGDGVAEERQTLISGVGRPVAELRVDHGQNGLEAGIDGWIYLALGDEGMREGTGTDGRKVQNHGGGVVRFRPDGTGLENWAVGTRNIYGLAVGPLLDVFARDNTNDGGGWDVRMHYFSGLTDHGYPSRYINFQQEIIQPIAEYMGGSGTGGMWLDEPGYPAEWNNIPITADWGQQGAFRHTITPNGATYTITNDRFLRAPNPADLDVDGNSVIYYVTTRNSGFNWVDDLRHGLMLRIAPTGYRAEPLPDFNRVSVAELVRLHESPSSKRRLEAQRAILRRPNSAAEAAPLLEALARNAGKDLRHRVAALFTLKQLRGNAAHPAIGSLVADPSIAAWALRALGDNMTQTQGIPYEAVTASLRSQDPRIRKEALITLARVGALQYATQMTPLLADNDPVVSHTAVQALRQLHAVDATLAVIDSPQATPALRSGALMVLQSFHETPVVQALTSRVLRETNAERRAGLTTAVARLANREREWNGDWWGTRPDTTGPYFQPTTWEGTSQISAALNTLLERADAAETVALGREFQRMGVSAGAAVAKFLAYADTEPTLIPQITAYFATAPTIPNEAIPVLSRTAGAPGTAAAVRAEAISALVKTENPQAWQSIVTGLQSLQGGGGAAAGGRGGRGGGAAPAAPAAPSAAALSPVQQLVATALVQTPTAPLLQAAAQARTALIPLTLRSPGDSAAIAAQVTALAEAEAALARARADGVARLQASVARLNPAQLQAFGATVAAAAPAAAPAAGGRGGAAGGRGGAAGRGGGGAPAPSLADQTRAKVLESPGIDRNYALFIERAAAADGAAAQMADGILLNLASRRFGATEPAQAATRALDAGWNDPRRRAQIMMAAVAVRDTSRASQIVAASTDADPAVAEVARHAMQQLAINPEQLRAQAALPKIGTLPVETVLNQIVEARGTVARGAQLVNELGCTACHTLNAAEPPKGPFLGAISNILRRRELAEAILAPNKTISQGFATTTLTLRDGSSVTGFLVREAGDMLTLRNIAAQEQRIPLANVTNRDVQETSLMPAGLANELTVPEFASLLDYLESLGGGAAQ